MLKVSSRQPGFGIYLLGCAQLSLWAIVQEPALMNRLQTITLVRSRRHLASAMLVS